MSPITAFFEASSRLVTGRIRELGLVVTLLLGCRYDFDQFASDRLEGSGGSGGERERESSGGTSGSAGRSTSGSAGRAENGGALASASGTSSAGVNTVAGAPESGCREGTERAGHCYYRIGSAERGLSFAAAQERCAEGGAHLVTFGSEEEFRAVAQQFFPAESDAWIGLWLGQDPPFRREDCTTAVCPWVWRNGEPLTYENWYAREPNYSGGCVRSHRENGAWVDDDCSRQLPALCERE